MKLKPTIPPHLRAVVQKESNRVLTVILIMLFSALAGVVAPIAPLIAIPLFIATGIGGVLLSDQQSRRSRAVGNLEGLIRHSEDIDELRREFQEVLQLEHDTINELKRRNEEQAREIKRLKGQ